MSVSIGSVNGGNKVEGHLSMVDTVPFFAKVGVLKGMGVGDVNSSSWCELVIFEGREDGMVMVDKCPEASRGHDGDELSSWRVLILLEVL